MRRPSGSYATPTTRSLPMRWGHAISSAFQPRRAEAVASTFRLMLDGTPADHKLYVETGTVGSTLQVFGQDASWLMNLEEKAREWTDVTDADVAAAIFAEY